MKLPKTLGIVLAALLTAASFVVSIKLGVVVVIALWIVARLTRHGGDSGGIPGVEQQSQARGRRPRNGNGGASFPTFHGR